MSAPRLQLLNEEGRRRQASETLAGSASLGNPASARRTEFDEEVGTRQLAEILDSYAAELHREQLEDAYRHMALTRAFDQEATSLQRQGELGLWIPIRGQEAAQVGSALAIPAQDMIFPAYREHAVAHVRGLDLAKLLPVFRGTRQGGWNPKDHNFHLYTFVIGAHTLHAVGYAQAIQQDRRRGIENESQSVTVYFGDGATSQGDVNEALVFAAASEAPVLFFCQNNQWAISVPTVRQSRTPLAYRADGFGIPRLRIDGNDLLASYAATCYAMDRIHDGHGPFFIEAVTYRMGAHTTSDDPTRYRSRAEEQSWETRDPLARVRKLLEAQGTTQGFFDEIDAEGREFCARVRERTKANSAGEFAEVFSNVYATPNTKLDSELAALAAYRAREEGVR